MEEQNQQLDPASRTLFTLVTARRKIFKPAFGTRLLASLMAVASTLAPAYAHTTTATQAVIGAQAIVGRTTATADIAQLSIQWDDNGQIRSRSLSRGTDAQTTIYVFDARHELIGATLPSGTTIAYRYQADGNLQSRTKRLPDGSSSTIHFLVDSNRPHPQIVAEYDDQGHPATFYVYGKGDELLMRTRGSETTYYAHDGLGSVTSLTDDAGQSIATYEYDAWGNTISSTGVDDNPYRFAGERFDSDLGFIYLRARWYDPQIGRFVSPDPLLGRLELPATLNSYLYANADPINLQDPGGKQTTLDAVAAEDSLTIQTNASVGNLSRPIFRKLACELGQVLAAQSITYGIYVLSDGINFYVGQSVDIDRRFAEHLRGILQQLKGEWSVVDRFAVAALGPQEGAKASKDLLRIAEQTVMDIYKDKGPLINKVNAIDKVNGRLKDAFKSYGKAFCG